MWSADGIQLLAPSGSSDPRGRLCPAIELDGMRRPRRFSPLHGVPSRAPELAKTLSASTGVLHSHLPALLPPASVPRYWSAPGILYRNPLLSICFRELSRQLTSWASSSVHSASLDGALTVCTPCFGQLKSSSKQCEDADRKQAHEWTRRW